MTPSPPPPGLRAVLFDAGNTLVFADRLRILEFFQSEGVTSDEERVIAAELVARAELSSRVETGAVGTEPHLWRAYFRTLFRRAGVPETSLDAVGRRLVEAHRTSHLWTHVEPGTHEVLEELLDAGYRLGVISNADGRMEEVLEAAGLRSYLEFVVDSAAVGVEKPDPRIFHEGLRRLDLPATRVLYVGDLYPVDVVGARGAGLEALLLDPSGIVDHPVPRLPSVLHLPGWLAGREG